MRHIIISGLPAAGKSTLARRLAAAISLPVVDKDDILESLFAARGVGDGRWRTMLSREADERLRAAAELERATCLVSWWRHPQGPADTGTPSEWLGVLAPPPLEVHCVCPVELAVARFLARSRHPGHLDGTKTWRELAEQFATHATLGPLAYGPVLTVLTESEVDLEPIIGWVSAQLGRPLVPPSAA